MKIELTKLEIDAIVATAGNMKDDMNDYFSFMPKDELKSFIAAYNRAMKKLKIAAQSIKS